MRGTSFSGNPASVRELWTKDLQLVHLTHKRECVYALQLKQFGATLCQGMNTRICSLEKDLEIPTREFGHFSEPLSKPRVKRQAPEL